MVKDKARVRARLVGLYPTAAGLTNERIDALAAKLKATDESTDEEINAELSLINDSGFYTFEQIKKEDDRVRTELSKKATETPKVTEPPAPVSTDPNEALLKRLSDMEAKLAAKDAEDSLTSLQKKFKADERLKTVHPSWVENNIPRTEEEYETAVTSLVDNYTKFATENKLEAYTGNDTPPAGAAPQKAGSVKEVSKEDADALAKNLLGR